MRKRQLITILDPLHVYCQHIPCLPGTVQPCTLMEYLRPDGGSCDRA